MGERRFSLRTVVGAVLLTLALTWVAGSWLHRQRLGVQERTLLESYRLVRDRFVGEYDDEALVDATLDGMVVGLGDRWSGYYDPQEYEAMNRRRENAYVGVGLTYTVDEDLSGFTVQTLVAGGPAQQAGIQAGERVIAVNGIAFTEENFEDTVALIGGEAGKVVTFTVEDGEKNRREVELALAQVTSSPVHYELLPHGVGYVRLENFYRNSAQETRRAVEDLIDQGARGLLFDVRANPGGFVDEMTDLLDYLLPQGPIFAEHTKDGPVEVTQSDDAHVELPMAALIDENTYSAAELFAAQLRESVAAPLIGQQTCGKGYYQQALELPNGGALNLSTGMYTTGGGVSLIGTGLTPDALEDDPAEQMEKALEILGERMKE